MENQDKNSDRITWYLFVGCMFIGMGIGAALGKGGIGTMVGMGVGFLASALYKGEKSK